MEIYIKGIQCDWYMGSEDFYEKTQITIDLIKKSILRNEEDGPYNIYAAYDDANWLQMLFRRDLVSIEIVCEPNHQYVYYDKKYEGQTELELIEFDQSLCPRIEACEDMTLAANIFFKTIDADTLCAGSISGNPLRRYNKFSNDSYSGFYLSKGMVFQRE